MFTQFVPYSLKVTEGETGEGIWPPINYLFFISTSLIYRENQQVRQGIVINRYGREKEKDLEGVLGPGDEWSVGMPSLRLLTV